MQQLQAVKALPRSGLLFKFVPLESFGMTFTTFIRNLIIGNHQFVSSYGEFKQAMLSGYVALMGVLACLIYLVTDITLEYYLGIPANLATIFFLLLSIYFHRQQNHCIANFILLLTMNVSVYIFSASGTTDAGTFIFFLCNAVTAFAIFSYTERILAILFTVSSYVLFIAACYLDFSILPVRNYSDDFRLFSVVVNFTIALPATVMGVYLLIDINHYNALQLVERNELLKKTNTELDRFVYSTSHDLRAPLTSLMGLINITGESKNPDEVKRYLEMMKERIHSLDRFIKDITDYSRNNRLEIAHEKVSLVSLADEVWESLKFTPEAAGINFQVDIPEDITVDSDKNRLKVIIANLVSNAIRYHDTRKQSKFIRLSADVRDKVFYLKVEDNGQGIPSEYHTRIFDMFYRANEQSKGSGLGLYIVKEALMKLSGSIQLESAPGVGSTFTIKLPNR